MHVLLIAGGWSAEREVSLSGAAVIEPALKRLGCLVTRFDPAESFDRLLDAASRVDFAFINLHGSPGEDGLIQAMLEQAGCPYQGSGPSASFTALHKAATKQIVRRLGLQTPEWEYVTARPAAGWQCGLRFPVVAKPNSGGSSVGVALCRSQEELNAAVERIFVAGDTPLVEEAIEGLEVTGAVLGDEPLPLILIRPLTGTAFFDYEAKYEAGKAQEICPAPLEPGLAARIQAMALAAHRGLRLTGYSRSDFMVQGDTPWFLEVNTLPGMTSTSLVPQAALAAGLSFEALLERLMDLGMAAHAARLALAGSPCKQGAAQDGV